MPLFELQRGSAPLVLSFPHVGTDVPHDLAERFSPVARTLVDTDWDVDRLYSFAFELGCSTLRANISRYVVDLNRDPADAPLYAGTATTTVCPTETFDGEPLYERGENPGGGEIALRVASYWQPYHRALAMELERVRAEHGYAILIDGHSIFGRLPRLFEGELPDVNLGTNDGRSCSAAVAETVASELRERFPSVVVDGRFKGGYITRHYGDPPSGVHALQIELNQRTYVMDGTRTSMDLVKSAVLSRALRNACSALVDRAAATPGSFGLS